MIKTQFEINIKHFRTDNGNEFMKSTIETYFEADDIYHEPSCINTPQQNGLAERKIGHILATTRSLFFQANRPLHYLGVVVLTTAHLLNNLQSMDRCGLITS